jgi:FtsP/CotA-like multicopper oxidase with cupredoxin domain
VKVTKSGGKNLRRLDQKPMETLLNGLPVVCGSRPSAGTLGDTRHALVWASDSGYVRPVAVQFASIHLR